MIQIEGIKLKPLLCKNDDCRKLLGYEKVKSGIVAFECMRCKAISIFRIHYSKGQENIDMLVDEVKGGE